jgi:membrane protease YdiL (CAAX protease family)
VSTYLDKGFDVTARVGMRGVLYPSLLLVLIYLVWFVRYSMWRLFEFVEPLFLMLILSYLVVLFLSLFFLKKDAKRSLWEVFRVHGYGVIAIAVVFAVIFQAVWFTMILTIGGNMDFLSFPSLKGYESYAVYALPLAFVLYVVFAVFGAFVEEVTFRGYVQSRVASRHGQVTGVFIASLLFSLQHIHIFQLSWIVEFFETQFLYVICFSVFVGYLFFKSQETIWSVFAFHSIVNLFNVSLPLKVTYSFPFATHVVTIASFAFMILLLRLVAIEELIPTTNGLGLTT